jgi:hypothetical protein
LAEYIKFINFIASIWDNDSHPLIRWHCPPLEDDHE